MRGKILRMSLTYPESQHHVFNTPWTAERDEALKRLWADGYSASLIADKIAGGDKITRCAVIGRVHRLKLPGRKHRPPSQRKPYPRANGAPKPPRPRPPPKPKPPPPPPPPPSPTAPMRPDMRKLPLLQLEPQQCRFPQGDPKCGPFFFCAADTREGEVYCPHHMWMARPRGKQ
jgi:GcrA cell cycle regulator